MDAPSPIPMILGLWRIYEESPPKDARDELIRVKAVALQWTEDNGRAFPKTARKVNVIRHLDGTVEEVGTPRFTTGGIVTVFEKAVVYNAPRDAVCFWLNRRGRKKKFGAFMGFVYGEVPVTTTPRLLIEYTVYEAPIEARKAKRRALRKRGVRDWYFDKYHAHNTLTHYARPGFKPKTPAQRDREATERLERRKARDRERGG